MEYREVPDRVAELTKEKHELYHRVGTGRLYSREHERLGRW